MSSTWKVLNKSVSVDHAYGGLRNEEKGDMLNLIRNRKLLPTFDQRSTNHT